MHKPLTLEQGKRLIRTAKNIIHSILLNSKFEIDPEFKKEFSFKSGCFVTLTINRKLRGCIGYPEAIFPLWKSLIDSAKNAAFFDPRFDALKLDEFKDVKIEVSVISEPELIKVNEPKDYIDNIQIGKHGLIVENGNNKGLLLPQVATEWNWDAVSFLENCSLKAGLMKNSWKEKSTKVYRFFGEIFSELNE